MPLAEGISFDLTVIWAFVIAFAVLVYVVLDGFDLGLGMLFALEPRRKDRDVMMNSVAPVWDGNETWLVLGGGGLFAAFPLAYALILPAVYAPVIAMLLALIFRGVAFEFRWRTERWKPLWDVAFISGSALAALSQGIILGALLQGIEIDEAARQYAGGWWDWLTPFTLAVGLGVMAGYMLLGACWLVLKTTGDLQNRMRRWAMLFAPLTVGFIAVVSLWTPFLQEGYYSRWFTGWGWGLAVVVAALTAAAFFGLLTRLRMASAELSPFLLALALFILCFGGLGVSMFPYIVPTEVTIWEAAAPEKSQLFMLIGAGILIPIILAYTAFAYWVFRGKIDADSGYH
ncbi:cytochrome d ubiquinol oxidase subunit II [Vannielia sp. SX4]|uniref:cytochrome d ubiquinol oxidase subunit II n=1 Tax=Vannielia sp. SX4 TaxID=3463852 RepID=UPI004058B4AC